MMTLDYQSNSRKNKEKKEKPDKIDPIVTGPVIQKEKTIGRKFKDIFFGGDFRTSIAHVGGDVFLPALRQLAYDIVVEGVKGVLFGESGYRRRGPVDYRSHIQYNTPRALPRPDPRTSPVIAQSTTRIPDQRPYRVATPQREMNQIILYSRNEAENVLERLTDII